MWLDILMIVGFVLWSLFCLVIGILLVAVPDDRLVNQITEWCEWSLEPYYFELYGKKYVIFQCDSRIPMMTRKIAKKYLESIGATVRREPEKINTVPPKPYVGVPPVPPASNM